MFGGHIVGVVAADDDVGHARALDRRSDQHLAGAVVEVGREGLGGRERTAGLHHEIDPQVSPRDVPRLVVGAGRDPSTIDEDRVAVDPDLTGIAAVDRVELEEVGRSGGVGLQVIDVGELDAVMAGDAPNGEPPDASEAVDADTNGHGRAPQGRDENDASESTSPDSVAITRNPGEPEAPAPVARPIEGGSDIDHPQPHSWSLSSSMPK